jgi:hypothetical protein
MKLAAALAHTAVLDNLEPGHYIQVPIHNVRAVMKGGKVQHAPH